MSLPKFSSLLKNWDSEPCTLGIFLFVAVANEKRSREDFTLIFSGTLELSHVREGFCRKGNLVFLKILSTSVLLKNSPQNGNCITINVFQNEVHNT